MMEINERVAALKPTIECIVEEIKKAYNWKDFSLLWCVLSFSCIMEEVNRKDIADFVLKHKEEIINKLRKDLEKNEN